MAYDSATLKAEYLSLLIKQYYEKPKANAEIAMKIDLWLQAREVMDDMESAFIWWEPDGLGNYNTAVLDLIGKIVGQTRIVNGRALSDADYVTFLEARIASNNASAYAWNDDRITLQDVVVGVTSGQAYVLDLYTMAVVLYFSTSYDPDVILELHDTGLLPRPNGVHMYLVQTVLDGAFGFADNPRCVGFADRFDSGVIGGPFAERIF